MPRPLAGFFIAGEVYICLHQAQDIADSRRLEFLTNISVPVDGAHYLALEPDDILPLGDELIQVLLYPNKSALAILVSLGKLKPQGRLAIQQTSHVTEFKADEFRAAAQGLIAHKQ